MVLNRSIFAVAMSFAAVAFTHAGDNKVGVIYSVFLPKMEVAKSAHPCPSIGVQNNSKHVLKVQVIRSCALKPCSKAELRFTHDLKSVSEWKTLKPGDALDIYVNKNGVLEEALHNETVRLKVRARMADKAQRKKIKDVFKVFNATADEFETVIDIGGKKKITMKRQK